MRPARVSAVVVSHRSPDDTAVCVRALAPQVDEVVVIADVPGSVGDVPADVRVIENARSRSLGANANRGFSETSGTFVVLANPDTVPAPNAVAVLREFAESHPRCGIAGPRLLTPEGSWQPSRRRFPTVSGTLVRRTPLRRLRDPYRHQVRHYNLGDVPTEPVPADWMLGAFLLLRRAMLEELGGFDAGFRMYGEDIDLCYRAEKAGWERWYVPAAVVRHRYAAVIDKRFLTRRTLWHLRGMLRFVRKHPERLRAL
ncbi:MAG: glycosyltransferase family 2 protein [Actinomycetota bacterium]|nr:glycosyltransferase family 2 protein [Actinomycetota bacterium]